MGTPQYNEYIPAAAHGGRFNPDPPLLDVIHSTEGPMSDGNAHALAVNWFGRPKSSGGAGTSTTGIFDPSNSVRMLDEHTIPYHVGSVGNSLSTGDEHCGSVNLTKEQWFSAKAQAMLDKSAKVKAQRAIARGWKLTDCRWLSLTEVASRRVRGFCTHNDIRLALGGTTHSDPGPNFPYSWFMGRIRYWFQFLTGTLNEETELAGYADQLDRIEDKLDKLPAEFERRDRAVTQQLVGGTMQRVVELMDTLDDESEIKAALQPIADNLTKLQAAVDAQNTATTTP